MRRILPLLFALVVGGLMVVGPALAQRTIIGAEGDEDARDAGPPPAPKDAGPGKKDDKKGDKKGDKKDDKKDDKKPAVEEKKKPGDNKDILEDTAAEKAKKAKEEEARKAAEKAAEDAAAAEAKKKEEEARKLKEEKKAAEDKRRLENRDQRLAAAKRLRQITRTNGDLGITFSVEPGEVKANSVVEIRVNVAKKLATEDPRYGSLMPLKGLELVATVGPASGKGAKTRYALHPLDAPGRYGFHVTPPKDGVLQVQISGNKDGKSIDATIPLHVGAWPPPDFDDEEKNNLAAADDAIKGRRKVIE